MPIACNPSLEANQREGKVSVKQSQALPRSLSSSPLGTRCLSFIPFSIQPSFSQLCSPVCIWFLYVAQLRSRDGGPGPALGGSRGGKSPGQLVWSRTTRNQQPSLFYPLLPWQTFALQLSSEASQQLTPTLLSGNANQSLHSPALQRDREKKEGREETLGERERWRKKE